MTWPFKRRAENEEIEFVSETGVMMDLSPPIEEVIAREQKAALAPAKYVNYLRLVYQAAEIPAPSSIMDMLTLTPYRRENRAYYNDVLSKDAQTFAILGIESAPSLRRHIYIGPFDQKYIQPAHLLQHWEEIKNSIALIAQKNGKWDAENFKQMEDLLNKTRKLLNGKEKTNLPYFDQDHSSLRQYYKVETVRLIF